MGNITLAEISVTPLKRISVKNGDVLHALKKSDTGYATFGEAYFSFVDKDAIKAWKLHLKMTLNLIVPIGEIRFIFVSQNGDEKREIIVGEHNYARITVPPGIWFGFQGMSEKSNLLLNIGNIEHDPEEVQRKDISEIPFNYFEI